LYGLVFSRKLTGEELERTCKNRKLLRKKKVLNNKTINAVIFKNYL